MPAIVPETPTNIKTLFPALSFFAFFVEGTEELSDDHDFFKQNEQSTNLLAPVSPSKKKKKKGNLLKSFNHFLFTHSCGSIYYVLWNNSHSPINNSDQRIILVYYVKFSSQKMP